MPGEYGFSINVSGKSVQQMKEIEAELGRLGITARDTTRKVEGEFKGLEDQLEHFGHRVAEVFALREVFNFGKEIMNTTAEFEGFDNRIRFASRNAYDGGQNIAFLREEADKLHIPLRQAAEGFSEMEAGLVGTGIEGERLRNLFQGISTAAATLHLPAYQLERTLYDLKEIGEIGINMRIARSLSTALPGIGGIVRETFGKSMHELEKEGISGGEFLAKLGPALTKHFEGGLAAFGDSLQAKIVDVKNSATKEILALGDQLKPTFISILTGIQDTFNSAPVRFFTEHITDLVAVLGRIIPMWLTYKGVMLLVNSATMEAGILFKIIEAAQMTMMFGFEGLSVAVGGFTNLLMSTGVGLFAVGLGYVISKLIDMNGELEKTINDITDLKASTEDYVRFAESFKKSNLSFESRRQLDDAEKGELYNDIQGQLKGLHKSYTLTGQRLSNAQNAFDLNKNLLPYEAVPKNKGESDVEWSGRYERFLKSQDELQKQIEQLRIQQINEGADMQTLQKQANTLVKEGLKPLQQPKFLPSDSNLHGSHLAGAEGGLNQARIVNLKIDTVMKVETHDNRNLKEHAEEAVQFIIRGVNNLTESKSGTF